MEQDNGFTLEDLTSALIGLGGMAQQILKSPDLVLSRDRAVTPNYEAELVQVAASAIMAIWDLKGGGEVAMLDVAHAVSRECDRQVEPYGPLPRRYDPLVWIAILAEELAEVAQEIK